MPAFDAKAKPTETDVINAYRLALGRYPESTSVIADRLQQDNAEWFPAFFRSGEFQDNVRQPILAMANPTGDGFLTPPPSDLVQWIADFVPLTGTGRDAVRDASDWFGIYHILYSDVEFTRLVLDGEERGPNDRFLVALEAKHRMAALSEIVGQIEGFTLGDVRGWAVDLRAIDRTLLLEFFVNGKFSGAGSTQIVRRELRDRFGGEGRVGFTIRSTSEPSDDRAAIGEVREAETGAVIGRFPLPARQPAIDVVAELRQEIDDLRRILTRIESKLPAVQPIFGFPLAAYDSYFHTYYAPSEASAPTRESVALSMIIDAFEIQPIMLDQALASVSAQSRRPREIIVAHLGGDDRIDYETLLDRWRLRFGEATPIHGFSMEPDAWAAGMNGAIERSSHRYILFYKADGVLAPDATNHFFLALENGASLVYPDEDCASVVEDRARLRHAKPIFRTAFDLDLLEQCDCLGDLLASTRECIGEAPFRVDRQHARYYDFLLRLAARVRPSSIVHLPRVLLHRSDARPPINSRAQMEALRDHLMARDDTIAIEPHSDILGADVEGAVRIRRMPDSASKVAIVIPTRDRLDLLEPCIDSIIKSRVTNDVRLEIIVVDNRSEAETMKAFDIRYGHIADLRVISHDGPFNWALINNRAAAQTDADVLVFLNNDTVVLSPDCWTELCVNALRPDVGAVGARLIYEDGTIQHAGMVMDPWTSFASHEGAGRPGNDPGYLGRHALLREVSTVTGACLATRASLFREVGGFDALHFPVEGNDTDYCLRLRSLGYRILYDPYATLYHFESRSRGFNVDEEKRRRAYDATQTLRQRWADRYEHDTFYNPHFDRLGPPSTRLQLPPNL